MYGAIGHCHLMLSQKKEQRVEAVLDLLDKCYAAYELALARLPDTRDANLWYGIGLLYERYGALMLPCDEQRDCLHHAEQALSHVLEIDAAFEKRREICYRLGLIFKQQSDSQRALGCFAAIAEDPPEPLQIADVWFQIGHVHESVEPMNAPLAKEAYEYALAPLALARRRRHAARAARAALINPSAAWFASHAASLTPLTRVLYCIRRYEIPSHPVWTTFTRA